MLIVNKTKHIDQQMQREIYSKTSKHQNNLIEETCKFLLTNILPSLLPIQHVAFLNFQNFQKDHYILKAPNPKSQIRRKPRNPPFSGCFHGLGRLAKVVDFDDVGGKALAKPKPTNQFSELRR